MPNLRGWLFVYRNWKLIVHLLLKTKRFGVNNLRRSDFESAVLGSWTKREMFIGLLKVFPVVRNYRLAKFRAVSLGFLHPQTCWDLGWRSKDLEVILGRRVVR